MLHVDYKTLQHHLRVLEENRLVSPSEKGAGPYGAVLFLHALRQPGEALALALANLLRVTWK